MEIKDILSKDAKRNPFKVAKQPKTPTILDLLKKMIVKEQPADKAE